MQRGINKVILVGTAGGDPELKYSQSGNAMAVVSLATNESWKDKQTGELQERTEWHRVKFFGRLAEIAAEYLKKGNQVYIEGSLRTDKYTDKNGVERYATDVIAAEMQLLGGRSQNDSRDERGGSAQRPAGNSGRPTQGQSRPSSPSPARAPTRTPEPAIAGDGAFDDDEIPF